MKILKLLFILLLCGFNHVNGQRTVHIKDVGWQFTLPAGTELLNSAFNKKGVLKPTVAIIDDDRAMVPFIQHFLKSYGPVCAFYGICYLDGPIAHQALV